MKKTVLGLTVLCGLLACQNKPETFEIEVNLDSIQEGTLIIYERKPPFGKSNPWVKVPITDGKCSYSGVNEWGTFIAFNATAKGGKIRKGCMALVENGKLKLSEQEGSDFLKLEGSASNDDYQALLAKYKSQLEETKSNSIKESEITSRYTQLYGDILEKHLGEKGGEERFSTAEKKAIDACRKSLDSIAAINGRAQQDLLDALLNEKDFAERDALAYMTFDLFVSNGKYMQQALDKWDGSRNEQNPYILFAKEKYALSGDDLIGTPAPDFEMPDLSGKKFKLSSLQGNNVLLVFSSSGCGWCKLELPFIKQIYENTKGKNFQILTIDLDHYRKDWENLVASNKIPWPVLCNLNENAQRVEDAYKVISIPSTFLIGPDGKFLKTGLLGKELIDFVDGLYK